MSTIEVYYVLSTAGQKVALLAGRDARQLQRIDVEATPFWLGLANISADGRGIVGLGGETRQNAGVVMALYRGGDPVITADVPQDAGSIASWARTVLARLAEESQERQAREIERHAEVRRREEEDRARREANALHYEAEQKAEREIAEKARAETGAWIQQHGSPRLRRLFADALGHEGVYKEERLALERPGWAFAASRAIPGMTQRAPYQPSDAEISLLDEARLTAPDAQLRRVIVYRKATSAELTDSDVEIDGDGDVETARGHAISAEFLGGLIWLLRSIPS